MVPLNTLTQQTLLPWISQIILLFQLGCIIEATRDLFFFEKSNGSVFGAYLGYGWGGNGFIFGADNIQNGPFLNSSGSDLNNWHFIVGVLENGNRSLYVDGKFISKSSSCCNSWNNDLNFSVAYHYSSSSNFFNGIIDNVRVYSKTLTASEVSSVYLAEIDNFSRKIAKK